MSQQQASGISLSGVLFVVFLVLKLTGNIAWSWWWITAPLWVGAAVVFALALTVPALVRWFK